MAVLLGFFNRRGVASIPAPAWHSRAVATISGTQGVVFHALTARAITMRRSLSTVVEVAAGIARGPPPVIVETRVLFLILVEVAFEIPVPPTVDFPLIFLVVAFIPIVPVALAIVTRPVKVRRSPIVMISLSPVVADVDVLVLVVDPSRSKILVRAADIVAFVLAGSSIRVSAVVAELLLLFVLADGISSVVVSVKPFSFVPAIVTVGRPIPLTLREVERGGRLCERKRMLQTTVLWGETGLCACVCCLIPLRSLGSGPSTLVVANGVPPGLWRLASVRAFRQR